MDKWVIKKASPGLDTDGTLVRLLGADFVIEEFDPAVPLHEQVNDAHVLLIRSVPVTKAVIDAAPRLCLIQRPGAHVESVDLEYAAAKRLPVCYAPPGLGQTYVAEHALFLILAVAKRYKESVQSLQDRRIGEPLTNGLYGKVLGLVGIGRTGTPLIGMAKALGMRVWAVKQTIHPGMREELGLDWLEDLGHLHELLSASDFVSIHVPLNNQTTGLVGRREIAAMKPGAVLVNIARGPIVDKEALHEALAKGRLAGAGLDVFWEEPPNPDDPLLRLPNVVATPHIAGFTKENREVSATIVAENIRRVRAGMPPHHIWNGKG